jgi:antitoxin StbD
MNMPFKPPLIYDVHGRATVGISALKANPAAVVAEAQERAVAVLNRNKPVAYIISPEIWELFNDALDELEDIKIVHERLNSGETPIRVNLEDL